MPTWRSAERGRTAAQALPLDRFPHATTPLTPTIPIQVTIRPGNPVVSAAIADSGMPIANEVMANAKVPPLLRVSDGGSGTTPAGAGGAGAAGTGNAGCVALAGGCDQSSSLEGSLVGGSGMVLTSIA
ncbi:MAG TPA: hypothetical protein DCM67_07230 [Propionibacteriaceae bacterium]|nr:hypothetical protein [Propionibacteriaceae bacterium]